MSPDRARQLLARDGQTDADIIARLTNAELRKVNGLRTGQPITATLRDILAEVAAETMETTP